MDAAVGPAVLAEVHDIVGVADDHLDLVWGVVERAGQRGAAGEGPGHHVEGVHALGALAHEVDSLADDVDSLASWVACQEVLGKILS